MVHQLFSTNGSRVVFPRSGVAVGKATLAKHLLAHKFPKQYVNVPFLHLRREP